MKITKIGWIGKEQDFPRFQHENSMWIIDTIWSKDTKDSWCPEDWPPRKVRITIEDAE
mgnify:FL=1